MRKFLLGCVIVLAAAATLLFSDLGRRRSAEARKVFRVAIFQNSSRVILDQSSAGVLAGLQEGGFTPGQNLEVTRFNPEGDTADRAAIAQTIVNGGFDMVVTVSTVCLQAMANANRDGRVIHVFCTVTDPYSAGVGLKKDLPRQRPRHLTGVATFQPVRETFLLIHQIRPDLARVGVVWCPTEVCSEQCLAVARKTCAELGITLEEANVFSTAEVQEAVRAMTAKGVQAMWIGGDNVVEQVVPSVVQVCQEAKIPFFDNGPESVKDGAYLAMGADYFQVGRVAGRKAARILAGADPAGEPIENAVPGRIAVNLATAAALDPGWRIPANIVAGAAMVIDETGRLAKDDHPAKAAAVKP